MVGEEHLSFEPIGRCYCVVEGLVDPLYCEEEPERKVEQYFFEKFRNGEDFESRV